MKADCFRLDFVSNWGCECEGIIYLLRVSKVRWSLVRVITGFGHIMSHNCINIICINIVSCTLFFRTIALSSDRHNFFYLMHEKWMYSKVLLLKVLKRIKQTCPNEPQDQQMTEDSYSSSLWISKKDRWTGLEIEKTIYSQKVYYRPRIFWQCRLAYLNSNNLNIISLILLIWTAYPTNTYWNKNAVHRVYTSLQDGQDQFICIW